MGGPLEATGEAAVAPPRTWFQRLSAPPTLWPEISAEAPKQAYRRLTQFRWLTRMVALLLLAGAGFVELYTTRATFGVNGWGDYFALLAWGFGAEASRQAISQVVESWGLSSPRSTQA
jgi:hypothetical protein